VSEKLIYGCMHVYVLLCIIYSSNLYFGKFHFSLRKIGEHALCKLNAACGESGSENNLRMMWIYRECIIIISNIYYTAQLPRNGCALNDGGKKWHDYRHLG